MATTISLDELHSYHRMDRVVFTRLVLQLRRDPAQSLLVVATWLWLEGRGFPNIIAKMGLLSLSLVNKLAEEAVGCLHCLQANSPPAAPYGGMIFTSLVMHRAISLQMFSLHRFTAIAGIKNVLNSTCARIFTDILPPLFGIQVRVNQRIPVPGFPHPVFGRIEIVRLGMKIDISAGAPSWGWGPDNNVSEDDRTMFLTFSRGFPVKENDVRDLFVRLFGDCVAAVHMQENVPDDRQPLFARLVLRSITTVDRILDGRRIAKFRFKGKHIWARKYERREY